MNTKEKWVALYSVDQKAMHIETLDQTIKHSIGMIVDGDSNDYMVIGVCDSPEEASDVCDTLQSCLDKRMRNEVVILKELKNEEAMDWE